MTTDVDANNIAEAQTWLEEDRQRLLDPTKALTAMQRRLDSAQLERNAAYGFVPTAAEPSRVASMRARGGAIGRALGALSPVYGTPTKNMRAAQAAAVGLDQLEGDELKDRLKRVHDLLDAANAQQDHLNQLARPAGSGSLRIGEHGDQQHTASSPAGEAHSGRIRTRRNPAPMTAGGLDNEPTMEDRHRHDPLQQPGRRPAPVDPATHGAATTRLGPRAIETLTPAALTGSISPWR